MNYDIYVYSFYQHKDELYHMLPNVKRFVDYDNFYLVYDDIFPEEVQPNYTGPIDWQQYEQQLGDSITIIPHSSLYEWQEHDIKRGWYRQQYVKMLLPTYAKTQYNIVCDSDVFFIKPYTVFDNNVPILYYDKDIYSDCYLSFIEEYLQHKVMLEHGTYVGSCSLWDANIIQSIWDRCYTLNDKDLINCIRDHIDTSGINLCFSEYETYGCFAQETHIIKPSNYRYIHRNSLTDNIENNIELLIFNAGMADYMDWIKENQTCY